MATRLIQSLQGNTFLTSVVFSQSLTKTSSSGAEGAGPQATETVQMEDVLDVRHILEFQYCRMLEIRRIPHIYIQMYTATSLTLYNHSKGSKLTTFTMSQADCVASFCSNVYEVFTV